MLLLVIVELLIATNRPLADSVDQVQIHKFQKKLFLKLYLSIPTVNNLEKEDFENAFGTEEIVGNDDLLFPQYFLHLEPTKQLGPDQGLYT